MLGTCAMMLQSALNVSEWRVSDIFVGDRKSYVRMPIYTATYGRGFCEADGNPKGGELDFFPGGVLLV